VGRRILHRCFFLTLFLSWRHAQTYFCTPSITKITFVSKFNEIYAYWERFVYIPQPEPWYLTPTATRKTHNSTSYNLGSIEEESSASEYYLDLGAESPSASTHNLLETKAFVEQCAATGAVLPKAPLRRPSWRTSVALNTQLCLVGHCCGKIFCTEHLADLRLTQVCVGLLSKKFFFFSTSTVPTLKEDVRLRERMLVGRRNSLARNPCSFASITSSEKKECFQTRVINPRHWQPLSH